MAMERPDNTEIIDRFLEFYRTYCADDIGTLAQAYPNDRKSLYLDWEDLYRFDRDMAEDYVAKPGQMQDYAEEALRLYDLPADVKLGNAHVRMTNLGETTGIRDIRERHHGTLISVQGTVNKTTSVRPKLQEAAFECQRCGTLSYIPQTSGFTEPHECEGCERQGPFDINFEQSEFVDAQTLRVQESPEGLRGGQTPEAIDVNIEDDVTGEVTAGDHVRVTGILRLEQQGNQQEKSLMFEKYMQGVSVEVEDEEFEEMNITEADKQEIIELSNDPDIYEKMVQSMAPSIWGYETHKQAIIFQLFSGVTKHLPDNSRIRGDLHMLLIGDPGTGKSQLLQYVKDIAPRSVYTSGKGSSAAGLTATAVRDDFGEGDQWSLEAGALVLADKGVAAIDELDKMDAGDRSAMHEALEQQSYHPETEILLADGQQVEIGELVDDAMAANPDAVVDGVDCEMLPTDDLRVHSVDLESDETTKLPVDRVSRHEAPDEFVRVKFSNGREVTVTPEHPMFVGMDGTTTPAAELDPGAFVPAPRKLPNSAEPVELPDEPSIDAREKELQLPDELTADLAELLGLLVAEGHSYAGSSHEVGFSNQDKRLLSRAERLAEQAFGIEPNRTTNAAGTVTLRWISTRLYRWFESTFPEFMTTAREKRIPARILGAAEEHIRRFLVGAFAGDGGVESEAMSFSTASEGLAEDYADALAKIGVASRIHHDTAEDSWKVYVMGDSTSRFVEQVVEPVDGRHDDAVAFAERSEATPRHHDVLPTAAATELRALKRSVGIPLTGEFRANVDEGFGVQVETVRNELEEVHDRIASVRRALPGADGLREVREIVGWSARQLAERIDGVSKSNIAYAERDGYDPERRSKMTNRAREAVEAALTEAADRADELESACELRYFRVTGVETVPNEGEHATDWVYDVTVEPTNTFVSKGVVLHNSISVSKAGINATLKSRCSLLGAANPKYGRFDEYESISEQIDLEPALISRFDLIFTITDKPDEEEDRRLAQHIIETNYAGELHTHRENVPTANVSEQEVATATEDVEPVLDADLLRKYVAHAKRSCYPTMTDEARSAIEEFYVDLRSRGEGEDAPVPVTARKLEALVRLAEASARVRLSDTVEREDADRVIDIVRTSLEDVGMDPETNEFDADMIEAGHSKSQRDRMKGLKAIIQELEEEYEEGAPYDEVLEMAVENDTDRDRAEHEIEKFKQRGEVYEPSQGHLRTT